jgi:LysR family transcriptional regulator, benzoate and cis,cis-muconate-responsive activator of ben and cat genes
MNLRQLTYFCETVEAGSAVQAAARVFVAPTAISMQIAQLEEELGGELFDRSRRPMELTALGQYFYPRAKELLADATRLKDGAQGVAAGHGDLLAIGYTRSSIFSVLPQAIRTFRKSRPGVQIELLTMLSEHQPAHLASGRIHIGISRFLGEFAPPEGLAHAKVLEDPFVVVLPSGHPLGKRRALWVADLDPIALVTYPKDPLSRFASESVRLLLKAGGHPVVAHEAMDIHSALGLVASGLGYCLAGRSVMRGSRDDLCFVPLHGVDAVTTLVAVTRVNERNALAQEFTRVLIERSGPVRRKRVAR